MSMHASVPNPHDHDASNVSQFHVDGDLVMYDLDNADAWLQAEESSVVEVAARA